MLIKVINFLFRIIIFVLVLAVLSFFNGMSMALHLFTFFLNPKYNAAGKIVENWQGSIKTAWKISAGVDDGLVLFIGLSVIGFVVLSVLFKTI